mgnify:CR=1 FL=1
MRPIHFEEANTVFDKPTGVSDEECLPISAYVGDNHINTVWMPSKEDLQALNEGRPIVVCVMGGVLPPLALFTYDENGQSNE